MPQPGSSEPLSKPDPAPTLALLRGPVLPETTLCSLWDALRADASTEPWLVFHTGRERESLSRADVIHRALGWAAAFLRAAPLENGGRVGVLLPNGPDFVAAFFAAQALGLVAVPLPWPVMDGAPERVLEPLRPVLQRARLDVLATTPGFVSADWGVPVVSAPREPDFLLAPPAPAPAFIQFTSGSTGSPRGAVISQRAALDSARAMAMAVRLGPADVGVSWLPFFHDMGLVKKKKNKPGNWGRGREGDVGSR